MRGGGGGGGIRLEAALALMGGVTGGQAEVEEVGSSEEQGGSGLIRGAVAGGSTGLGGGKQGEVTAFGRHHALVAATLAWGCLGGTTMGRTTPGFSGRYSRHVIKHVGQNLWGLKWSTAYSL